METEKANDGHAQLMAFAHTIHPQMEIAPCDLKPGGRYALPPGFELHLDPAHDESVIVFGPHDASARIKTLVQYGGRYLIRGLDLLRGLATALRAGEPVWEKSLDTQANYWRALLATAAPFTIPAPQPRTRIQMEQHINSCDVCKPVSIAYGKAVDSGASITNDAHVTAMIDKAHADPAAATAHYLAIADGRNSTFTTAGPAADKARTKRAAQPDLAAAGKES